MPPKNPETYTYEPRVDIATTNEAVLEAAAWTNAVAVVVDETLPSPLIGLMVRISGSSDPEGEYAITADIKIPQGRQQLKVAERFAEFTYQCSGLGYDGDDRKYIVSDDEANRFLMSMGDDAVTIAAIGEQELDDTFTPTLSHGSDPFTPSFENFTGLLCAFLEDIYRDERDPKNLRFNTEILRHEPLVGLFDMDLSTSGVTLEDIAGLNYQKSQIAQMIFALQHPDILAKWGAERQQGLLLYGPPGTGKTSLIEAVANELRAELVQIKSNDIYNMWLGGSETRMQAVFDKAMAVTVPTVLLFDEIDGIISSDNHSTHQRVAALFKQGTSQLANNPHVLLAATTNKGETIDPALLRSGRFDVKLLVPKPNQAERLAIVSYFVNKYFQKAERTTFAIMDLNYDELAKVTDDMTGADINKICKGLLTAKAFAEMRMGDTPDPISQREFMEAIQVHKTQQLG